MVGAGKATVQVEEYEHAEEEKQEEQGSRAPWSRPSGRSVVGRW